MLKIKTYLDRSPIHGIGLFAGEDITCNQVVWEFNPAVDFVYTPEQWSALQRTIASASFGELQKYAYKENNVFYLCTDNAQYMNHSDTAYNIANDARTNLMYARKEIGAAEELLCNYFEFCDEDDFNLRQLRSSGLKLCSTTIKKTKWKRT